MLISQILSFCISFCMELNDSPYILWQEEVEEEAKVPLFPIFLSRMQIVCL